VALMMLLIIAAQLLAGNFGWMDRYETYVMSSTIVAILFVFRSTTDAFMRIRPVQTKVALFGLLIVFGLPISRFFIELPEYAHSIYLQQYQMHRFATSFLKQPVAVNDLGWVSYRNPYRVVDLVGLGSERARRAREARSPAMIETLVAGNRVPLAMLYPESFEGMMPPSFRPIAKLITHCDPCAPIYPAVTFYATGHGQSANLLDDLIAFKQTLPAGSELQIFGLPASPAEVEPVSGSGKSPPTRP
jgi:hypothetical protein